MTKERQSEVFYRPFVEAKAQADAEIYKRGISLPVIQETVREGFRRAAALLEEFKAQAPPPRPLACKAGCSLCCRSQVVSAAPSEVIHLLGVLRSRPDFQAIKARVCETWERTRILSEQERISQGIPCPLLEEDKCAVYEDRPQPCRACTSIDASYCEQNPGHAQTYVYQLMVHRAVHSGLMEGAAKAGLESTPVELIQALYIGLNNPGTVIEFLQGRSPLAAAEAYDAFAC